MDILKSVGAAIAALFDYNTAVFTEAIPNENTAPCFFIQETEHFCERSVGNRFLHKSRLCVTYYPESKFAKRAECEKIARTLFVGLEFVDSDEGMLHGIEKHYEIKDGVMRFYLGFDYFTIYEEEKSVMERLSYNGKTIN